MSATTTDLELIALAAKAAGIHWCRYDLARLQAAGSPMPVDMLWNPLKNDGDTFGLQVQLDLVIDPRRNHVFVVVEGCTIAEQWDDHAGDKRAATRRAVTRAAAESALAAS